MNDQPPSGNRWEQHDDTAPVQPPVPPSRPTAMTPPAEPTPSTTTESRRRWPSWARDTRVKLGAVGAAIFLVGGGAGYGLAHANTDDSTFPNRGPGPGFGDGSRIDRHGFDGQDGQDGKQPGQQPGQQSGTDDGSGT
jgi:hypothetical protein